ncbi:MAG: hypothetical protein ACI9J2_000165 [Saprospiraceae bacterium]|jgi:hypothetical protein
MGISHLKKILIATSLLLITSCAHHGAAYIQSVPSGAEVVDLTQGTLIGVTPVKVWWQEGSSSRKFINLRLQKEGYEDKTTSFWVALRHGSRDSAMRNAQPVEMNLDKVN